LIIARLLVPRSGPAATPCSSIHRSPSGQEPGASADFEPPFLVRVTARESGLPRDGWIKCDQPATLPTSMLGPRVGRLSPAAIERLDAALRFVLGV
jgi:hypothetical protein